MTIKERSWLESSEIVAGLILLDKLQPTVVNPSDLYMEYKEIIPLKRDGISNEEIITRVGLTPVTTALRAAKTINGEIEPLVWVSILEKLAVKARVASKVMPKIEKLQRGEHVDVNEVLADLSVLEHNAGELIPLSEVKPTKAVWIKTGYRPLDFHVGGVPDASLTILAASPGIGKTTLAIKIAIEMVKKYTSKKVAIFTLEMTNGQICKRAIEVDDTLSDEDKRKNILIADATMNVKQVFAIASQAAAKYSLSLIVVDYADLLVSGDQSEATMGVIYRTLQQLAKQIGVPVLLVSQLNRGTYGGGIPKVNHIRYSGMAEACAASILLAYNPFNILADFGRQDSLPIIEGMAYLIVGKSKYGYKRGSPGAIQIEWDGAFGWGNESKKENWFVLAS
jgi:replicative DNA helicase